MGIDINKKTFDAAIYSDVKGSRFAHEVCAQTEAGYTSFSSWLQDHDVLSQDVLFCMEHTGIYIFLKW